MGQRIEGLQREKEKERKHRGSKTDLRCGGAIASPAPSEESCVPEALEEKIEGLGWRGERRQRA